MGGSLLSKAEVPDSSLLGHLPKEFSLRLTWCPWLVGYYGTRGISRGARKLAQTPSLSKKIYIYICSTKNIDYLLFMMKIAHHYLYIGFSITK